MYLFVFWGGLSLLNMNIYQKQCFSPRCIISSDTAEKHHHHTFLTSIYSHRSDESTKSSLRLVVEQVLTRTLSGF